MFSTCRFTYGTIHLTRGYKMQYPGSCPESFNLGQWFRWILMLLLATFHARVFIIVLFFSIYITTWFLGDPGFSGNVCQKAGTFTGFNDSRLLGDSLSRACVVISVFMSVGNTLWNNMVTCNLTRLKKCLTCWNQTIFNQTLLTQTHSYGHSHCKSKA